MNLTPLLDTVFLLIIILMCTLIHMRVVSVVEVSRPVVTTGASVPNEHKVLQLAVQEDGQIVLDGLTVALNDLPALLAARGDDAGACLISADRQARHGRVTKIVVAAKQAFGHKPIYFEVERNHRAARPGVER